MKTKITLLLTICFLSLAVLAIAQGTRGIGPYPSLGSCSVFPRVTTPATASGLGDQSAWHQDISQAPVDPNSDHYIAYINSHGGAMLHPDFGSPRSYGFPYTVVGAKTDKVPVHFTAYGSESDPGPYYLPRSAAVEGGQNSSGDRHILVINRSRCRLYELYHAFFKAKPRPHFNADQASNWDLNSAALRPQGWTSADAAGLPIFPGLVRYDEIQNGVINHAIRVTLDSTQNAWINPASHCAGDTSNSNAPPMGLRLRLRGNYDLSGFTGAAQVIAVALEHYGLIVADNGSNWFFGGTSDQRWNNSNLDQLKSIPGSAFEVIQSASGVHTC